MQTQTKSPTKANTLQFSGERAEEMQILVIDDSETDRMRILRLCKDAGLNFASTEVETIDQFRKALSSQQFDLIFIDYLLAGEDGLQAIDVLKEHPEQRAASIMIAGEGQIGIAVEAMRRGCSDYLTKPELTVSALQKSVATAIERRVLSFSLAEERAMRLSLETTIRQYASNCSAEMRSILSATLRRVRKLRSHQPGEDRSNELGALEETIDQLWNALPAFNEAAERAVKNSRPKKVASVTNFRPNQTEKICQTLPN